MVVFCKSRKCLVGKTAIITGGNAGIGFATALDLSKRGCRVILACRNQEKALEAREKIVQATGNENVVFKHINLESLTSVREFARDILATEERLDILINNAGAVFLPERLTEDGLQLEMATNYFSHFLLTNLLLDLLRKSAPSRVINVSSVAAKYGSKLKLEQLNDYGGGGWGLYAKTKLCNIMFTQELGRRLEGSGVTTYSLHPGVVHTKLQNYNAFIYFFSSKFFKTIEEGAQTSLYLALEDNIEEFNGEHFDGCKRVQPYSVARNKETAKKLWEISEELVGLRN